jgi:hypothetical protein
MIELITHDREGRQNERTAPAKPILNPRLYVRMGRLNILQKVPTTVQ